VEILVIDGVVLWDFDYIDLGRIRMPSQTVPVTVKSLVFSEDPRDPQGRRDARIAAITSRQAEPLRGERGRRPLKSKGNMSAQTERQMASNRITAQEGPGFREGDHRSLKLKDELARLRAMPRVRKGSEIKFVDGPQAYSRHYVEPHDG